MIVSLLLAVATQPSPDAMAAPLAGLYVVVEEDGQPDRRLSALETSGCNTRVVADGREWMIDWRRADAVALEDTFVFVSAPPAKLAFVARLETAEEVARLRALYQAMRASAERCSARLGQPAER